MSLHTTSPSTATTSMPSPKKNAGSSPSSSSSAKPPPSHHPPQTFSATIERDHSEINALALRLAQLLRQGPITRQLRNQQLSLLHTLTYRLIRHDISEDLIMRPAFIRYLPPQLGMEFAEHDRVDHDNARIMLLQMYSDFERLELSDVMGAEGLRRRFGGLMRELAEHMREESGREIPMLERVVGREESGELARRYEETYVLGPEMVVKGRRVWRDEGEFVKEGRDGLVRVWEEWRREQIEERRRMGGSKL